jgi:hypothetical protein
MSQKPAKHMRAMQFGPEYEQLLLTVWEKTPFRFPCKTDSMARAMRSRMYTYFQYLRRENLRLDLVEMADALTIQIDGNVMILTRHEDTWDHENIRQILGLTEDKFGLTKSDGSELKSPDLLGVRLAKQVKALRERDSGGQKIVPPFKT